LHTAEPHHAEKVLHDRRMAAPARYEQAGLGPAEFYTSDFFRFLSRPCLLGSTHHVYTLSSIRLAHPFTFLYGLFGILTWFSLDVIDLPHNQFRPLHGSGNHLVGSRTSLRPAEQVISHVKIAGHDYPSNDADDPLASFVHGAS
jgi:hypothetical protein